MRNNVVHNIAPFWHGDSEMLILGSFPSVKSRQTEFFYAHPQNRFWRVMATLFGESVPKDIEGKKALLTNNRIALWDVIFSCSIVGSSDSSIRDAKPNDVLMIIDNSKVDRIYVNGKTAEYQYNKLLRHIIKREAIPLPSTSAANASWDLDKLVNAWSVLLT